MVATVWVIAGAATLTLVLSSLSSDAVRLDTRAALSLASRLAASLGCVMMISKVRTKLSDKCRCDTVSDMRRPEELSRTMHWGLEPHTCVCTDAT